VITICHWMLYFTLELILPTEIYLPITVTDLLHIQSINTAIQLLWKHLHTKPTPFFLRLTKILAKTYDVTHVFTEIKDSVAGGTFDWINSWFGWILHYFSDEFEVSFWGKEWDSKRSVEIKPDCFDVRYFSFITDFIGIEILILQQDVQSFHIFNALADLGNHFDILIYLLFIYPNHIQTTIRIVFWKRLDVIRIKELSLWIFLLNHYVRTLQR